MKIKSEFDLIEKIDDKIKSSGITFPKELIKGIGDDAAVYDIGNGRFGIFTTDISVESVHFIVGLSAPYDIGYKAMMGNVSDINAMGGFPKLALVSLGIPVERSELEVLSLYDGLIDAAKEANTIIAGGDMSAAGELIINIALYGEAGSKPVLRSTAKEGDKIYLTGSLGGSLAGLEILKSGDRKMISDFKTLVEKHLRPCPRINLTERILKDYKPTSMIDISDGLLSDLGQICRQSNRGFILYGGNFHIPQELKKYSLIRKTDPLKYVFESGEEYELVFTSEKKLKNENDRDITLIGEVTKEGFLLRKGDVTEKLTIKGFDHFNKQ